MATYDALAIVDSVDGQEHSEEEMLEAWQALVDNGAAWTLPGRYGRTARQLIEEGVIHE